MIKINNLTFSYGRGDVLKDISLQLNSGNIYGLLGENGVGKTTLLTLLCGLKNPQQGNILIDGFTPYKRDADFLSGIYYLSDEVPQISMTAPAFGANYGKLYKTYNAEHYRELLDLFEVPLDNKMDKMSSGQLKKMHISFALASGCRYLLMDEPTNGLDIPSKSQFRKALMKYTGDEDTVIISTHQVKDLENVIDPIIILDKTDLLLNASIQEITDKLYFDYDSPTTIPDALYSEEIPGGRIQVRPNTSHSDSKVNIEALFNAVHAHKDWFKATFNK